MKFFKFKKRSGIAALPAVLIIGGFVTEIVIVATVGSFLLVNSEYNIRLSSDALFAARSGINDAVLKIARDRSFTSASYGLPLTNSSVDISVCKDAPCTDVGKSKITSTGTVQNRSRRLEAVVVVDNYTGNVRLESLKEVSL